MTCPPLASTNARMAFTHIVRNLTTFSQENNTYELGEDTLAWTSVPGNDHSSGELHVICEVDTPKVVVLTFSTSTLLTVPQDSRQYKFLQWLPKLRRAPRKIIVEGAILRCKLTMQCAAVSNAEGETRITEWQLQASRITRCFRPSSICSVAATRRIVPHLRDREIIDLTLDSDTGKEDASGSAAGLAEFGKDRMDGAGSQISPIEID
uniref:Ig-like domain-containing protein n=1 Tax=Mycena chlorophos TaxID=658473 RepID=A0ABQ0M8Q2_MYCCL|nr:predicted protein [Mycena chlorophos]